ncbi:gas vesicle protein GVPa [Gemmatirosa kalamazoonensis]|uniref:Gas vesicle protein GVPa n=1 Tax=Gemmatirosa kalamazoonensis TaxID=861299 RepID=W0RDF9_9BACT|nr:gas vesicle protein [Gemmatirosa kalamazoonensis]AHG88477.1 gas vesicle protein GVPa [Gemmatirosa kalamazoonensis]
MTHPAPLYPDDDDLDALESDEQLVLADLLNHVLDKGVVIHGSVIISIASIELVSVDLRLVLASVESLVRREKERDAARPAPNDAP